MVQSIIDIILVIAYLIGFVINPLHREKRNGFSLGAVGILLLIFWVGLAAGIYGMMGIPLTLVSINVAIAVAVILMWMWVPIKRKISKPIWPIVDVISLVIILGFVMACCVVQFGWKLNLTYGDIDPARYMYSAMTVIRKQIVSGTYLTTLINAWCMLVGEAFVLPINMYRGMILADILMHLLSMWVFYILLAKINHGKGRGLNPVISILYFCGYQLYNLVYGAFFHWVDGILIIMFLIYIVWLLEEECISNIEGIVCAVFGLFGLLICYPYFMIIVIPLFLPEVIVWLKKNLKQVGVIGAIGTIAGIVLLGFLGWTFAGQRIGNSFAFLLKDLQAEGLAYKEPYMDFIFFVLVLVAYIGLLLRKKKQNRMFLRMSILALIFMGVWFYLMAQGYLSMYYYRMYYVLWLIAWIMVAHTVYILVEEKRILAVVSCSVFYVFMAILSAIGVNQKIYHVNSDLYMEQKQTSSLFPLYRMNYLSTFSERKNILTELEMELCNQVINKFEDIEVPIIHSVYSHMQANWYQGITGQNIYNRRLDLDKYSMWECLENLQNCQTKYLAVIKSDLYYEKYKDYVFDKLDVAYENAEAAIYTCEDFQWRVAADCAEELTKEERELFHEVRVNYKEKNALLCESILYTKMDYYTIYTGIESYKYAEIFTPEKFIPKTYELNINEMEYITVLKDSEMYRLNQEYFDSQIILYENEAGMILQHAGTGWMPSEQE